MANHQINISTNGTTTLATAGKYCDRNIDVNVDVASEAAPTAFTNVLKHESTTVLLNKNAAAGTDELTYNGDILVYIDLVGLGFNTHPAELTFRWRGMFESGYPNLYVSTNKTSWSGTTPLYNATRDEHGDFSLYKKINYPTSNRYLKVSFRLNSNKIAVTQDIVDKCILTINEPIGNGGYVG
jgi:hypothetical protein